MIENKTFETKKLILKPTTEEDAEFFFELHNSSTWIKYIGCSNTNNIADARKFIIDKIMPQLEQLGYSNYTIIRKSDHLKIGSCGLVFDREGLSGNVDIGFAFLPKYHKKGFAFEAANKVKNIAFDVFGIAELFALTTKENIPSQKLLEKLNFNFVDFKAFPNIDVEMLVYKTT